MSCPSLELWLEALDLGGAAPEGAHPDDCATCAGRQAEARDLLAALGAAAPPSPLGEDEFVARVLAALPAAAAPRPSWRRVVSWSAPLAAAAVIVFVLATRPPVREDAPVARGSRDVAAKWCEVAVARPEGVQFLADDAHVPADASLAFRVRHGGPEPAWLGIFAVTEAGRVAWYYPAYESAADDPVTVRLPAARDAQLLSQRVRLPLGEGRVRIVCWKADREWRVRKADAIVERASRGGQRSGRVPELGGDQQGVEIWMQSER